MTRLALSFAAIIVSALPVLAQPVNLSEKTALGERSQYSIDLELKGNLSVAIESGMQTIPLEAQAQHRFSERIMAMTDRMPIRTARFYSQATATVTLAGDKSVRSLPAERKLIIAQRQHESYTCYALAGPLSRDELDLVSDHFNPQCLPGLLPGKVVNIGDTWTIGAGAAQAACLFDAATKCDLTGKLTAVKEGLATFTIEGTAEGVESGSKVSLTIKATGTFDSNVGHFQSLTWKQQDSREQGPINPASKVDATITLKREELKAEPAELSDRALAAMPTGELPQNMVMLTQSDSKGRYHLLHAREWHATGQTDTHLILRLLDRGDLIAQATITVWNRVEAGKHVSVEDFKKAVATAPGWAPGKVLFDRELPAPEGRWLYRLSVEGKMEDEAVVQTFYLLAGPRGEQIAVTVATKPEKVKDIENRDLTLVNAIEFGNK